MTHAVPAIEASTAPPADRAAILERLVAFNRERHGPSDHLPFTLVLRDASGDIVGGAYGATYYGWAFVEVLFVPAELRGRGLGAGLIGAVERLARERGCAGIWLDTYAFQAPGFYRRLGFTDFGEIDGFPPGASRIFFSKRLG